MKDLFKIIRICLFVAFITVCSFNTFAQEDKISGVYVDGVKVTEIDCYSFKKMEIIFSVEELKGFDLVQVGFKPEIEGYNLQDLNQIKENGLATFEFHDFTQAELNLKTFTHAGIKYARIKIYSETKECSEFAPIQEDMDYRTCRNQLYVRKDDTKKRKLKVSINGKTVSGFTEKYDEMCNCIKKLPIYDLVEYLNYEIGMKPNTNGNEEPPKEKQKKVKLAIFSGGSSTKYLQEKFVINYNLLCPVKGQKLEDLIKTK